MRPGNGAQIGATGADDRIGMVGFRNRADGDGGDADLVADLVGKRRLIKPAVNRLVVMPDLAGRAIDHVSASGLEQPREQRRVFRRVAAFRPVVTRQPHRHRPILRPDRPDRAKDFERVARAVLRRAAKFVGATVGQRREKAREQIAVRAMQFENVEAGLGAAARGGAEIRLHPLHVIARHLARDGAVRQIGHRRSRHDRPIAMLQRLIDAFPRHPGRALAAGMAELKSGLGRGGVNEIDQAFPGFRLFVVPKTEAPRRDPCVRRHAGHLAEDEPGAAQRAAAQMHQMEIVRHAVDGRIHRHRRDDDTVRQGDAADRVRREHRRHRRAV